MSVDNPNMDIKTELKARILRDPNLSEWFFELCIGKKPRIEVSEDTLKLMEEYAIIKRTDKGLELDKSGIEFGRDLGLIRKEGPIALLRELLEGLR